jgi:sigma-B regulation protein RsbU (phosphoserine phosphatase)
LPEVLPVLPGCDVSAYYQPSGRASGDYYDIVKTSEDTLSFIVADVSGHGAPAAVVMAMSKTAFRLLLSQGTSVNQMFPEFNNFLCDNLSPDMFVTAVGGTINVSAGLLEYVSAGHTPSVLSRGETGDCEMLTRHGMLLGVLPDQEFLSTSVKVTKGDKLIVYTDGVTEARNEVDEMFGAARLVEAIKKAPSSSSAGYLAHSIIRTVTEFTGGRLPDDDMTLLIFAF